ncbi:Hpt domain-containing protein [Desulfonatronum lacustre]|uniref:Hpt domain-containing protein n=1 Tax=Desulfonatronum lacustre TaxID=66849 RepID=UPI0004913D62|nr:Hpt domain-containing protein [Desulfonatronum lacustre]
MHNNFDDDEELFQGFFLDVEESFSPQVAEALSLVRSGQVEAGIDMMFRPLHTIKGTSTFINLSDISTYTHKVEDYMKAIQSGRIPRTDQAVDLLIQAVDMVFSLLDKAKVRASLDQDEIRRMEARLAGNASSPVESSGPVGSEHLMVEHGEDNVLIRLLLPRIHLPGHSEPLLAALRQLPKGQRVVLDLSKVRTMNSTTWGAIFAASQILDISVTGLTGACRTTFYAWGFEQRIREIPPSPPTTG